MLVEIGLGNFINLTLRFRRGFKEFLRNWDLEAGPFQASYCWHRPHRFVFDIRKLARQDGIWWFTGERRAWALGANYQEPATGFHIRGHIWRRAYPNKYWGQQMFDGRRRVTLKVHVSNWRKLCREYRLDIRYGWERLVRRCHLA